MPELPKPTTGPGTLARDLREREREQGLGFRVQGLGFRVQGLGLASRSLRGLQQCTSAYLSGRCVCRHTDVLTQRCACAQVVLMTLHLWAGCVIYTLMITRVPAGLRVLSMHP